MQNEHYTLLSYSRTCSQILFLLSSDEIVEYGDRGRALQKVEKVENRSKRSKR